MSEHGLHPATARKADRKTGSRMPVPAVIATVVAVVMTVLSVGFYLTTLQDESAQQIVIATGPESGTYHALGLAMARVLEAEGVAQSVQVIATEGSVANMGFVGGSDRRADFAFVQSDARPDGGVRLIAQLYQEILHVLVATRVAGEIVTLNDLAGRRVSLGTNGSGTRSVAERVIEHFGITVGEDLAIPPEQVVEGLVDGTIDAAFFLSAIPSAIVEELCERDAVRFLTLGDAQLRGNATDALELVFPSLTNSVIPRSTYENLPTDPVATVQVAALLVASSDLDTDLVRTVTSTLFVNRSRLIESDEGRGTAARRIRERFQPEAVLIPYHDGAVDYYRRSDPPFIVEYAETLSFILTVMVGLFSVGVAAREWMRRKMKNRIDLFYVEVEELTTEIDDLSLDELLAHREALRDLQRRAFAELVSERLEANESFTIFQDYVASERVTISARIAEKTASLEES